MNKARTKTRATTAARQIRPLALPCEAMKRLRRERNLGEGGDAVPEVVDLSALLRPYENQWVALSADASEVLSAAPTLGEAKRAAEKTGKPHHFLHVLPFDVSYAPTGG